MAVSSEASAAQTRYRILSVLGEGAYGRVYRARLEGMGSFTKDVALKILHEQNPPAEVLARFRDEARMLGLLSDRAVVKVEPPMLLGHQWALVMEFVDGVSLSTVVKRGPIPPGAALDIVEEVARTLDNVWKHPGPDGRPLHLMHRDLKPANIKITPTGDVRILDFGLARADFDAREARTTVNVGGTLGYLAPERFNGDDSAVSDVYSLGVMLHELVTGERPRFTSTPMKTIESGAGGSESLLRVLRLAAKMRSGEPADRPSAREVERQCQLLKGLTPPPYLRDWAEKVVREGGADAPSDPLVGLVLGQSDAAIGLPGRGGWRWTTLAAILGWAICGGALLCAVAAGIVGGALGVGVCATSAAAGALVAIAVAAGVGATLLGRIDARPPEPEPMLPPREPPSSRIPDASSTLGHQTAQAGTPKSFGDEESLVDDHVTEKKPVSTPPLVGSPDDDEEEMVTRVMAPRGLPPRNQD